MVSWFTSQPRLKGCLGYIFTSLFLSLKESTGKIRENVFLFHFKSSFSSPENESFEF